MAPTYKLTYFNVKGLGEPIRVLLSYGNVEFEDIRIAPEQWPSLKESTLFGKLPMLQVDGKQASQSIAICRYLAKQFGLTGSSDWENLEIDAMVDTFSDFRSGIASYHYEQDEKLKEEKKGPLFEKTVPYYMTKFEEIVAKNKGYFVGGKMTWADVYFFGIIDYCNAIVGHDLLEKYPHVQALKDKVASVPGIKAWVEKRPNAF